MTIRSLHLFILMTVIGGLLVSCNLGPDEYSEEDLVDEISTADVSVALDNASGEAAALEGIDVTLFYGGEGHTKQAGSEGVASFSGVPAGDVRIKVTAENFTNITGSYTVLSNSDFSNSQQQVELPLLSTEEEHTARLSGRVTYYADLAADSAHAVPAGTSIFTLEPSNILPSGFEYDEPVFDVKVGDTAGASDGSYVVNLPATSDGLTYGVTYHSFTLEQRIAVNRFAEEREFPHTEPAFHRVETVFGEGTPASIPTVPATYAVIDEEPGEGGEPAVISGVSLDGRGGIDGLTLSDPGLGYTPNSQAVDVRVEGLLGGSGARIVAETDADGSVTGFVIEESGSGYKLGNANRKNTQSFSTDLSVSITLKAGSDYIRHMNFGTGIERARKVR